MSDILESGSTQRQLAMVLDLNKCLGCQTCTVACKKLWNKDSGSDYAYWNSVETQPGRGYPAEWRETGGRDSEGAVKRGEIPNIDTGYGRAWNFNHKQTFESSGKPGAQKEWLRPDSNPKWGANWDEDRGAGEYPGSNHYFYLPRLCNHCTHAACLEACPRKSIYKREEDGIVLVDQDRCHGYRFCVEACPSRRASRWPAHGSAPGGCVSSDIATIPMVRSGSSSTSGRSRYPSTPSTGSPRTSSTSRR